MEVEIRCRYGAWVLAASSYAFGGSTFTAGVSQGEINASVIIEASGLVASQTNTGVYWTHNDSGGAASLYALDGTGHLLGTYALTGATNVDWEDIAVGPGPVAGVKYLYVATIGSTKSGGTTVYRVPEPAVYGRQASAPVTISLSGVDTKQFTINESDGESMFVDPLDGAIYIGSKESGHSDIYKATQTQFGLAGVTTLSASVASVPLSKANGADISYDGRQIIVRNQGATALLYHRAAGQTVAQALATTPDAVGINGTDIEPNAEAIAFDANGRNLFTVSEGSFPPLYKYTRTSNDAPAGHQQVLAQGATWRYLAGGATPAAGWSGKVFADGTWASGAGQFGYGHGDERTTIAKGASSYFRTTFSVGDPSGVSGMVLRMMYDDGAAVYINGVEVTRQNLVAGAGAGTYATTSIADALQYTWLELPVASSLLVPGVNTVAVEIHSASAADADMRFDLQMAAGGLGADLNGDGVMSAADLAILDHGYANHLAGPANGDLTGDGVINADDYALFDRAQAKFGTSGLEPLGVAVPEPGGLGAVVGVLMIGRTRRARRAAKP